MSSSSSTRGISDASEESSPHRLYHSSSEHQTRTDETDREKQTRTVAWDDKIGLGWYRNERRNCGGCSVCSLALKRCVTVESESWTGIVVSKGTMRRGDQVKHLLQISLPNVPLAWWECEREERDFEPDLHFLCHLQVFDKWTTDQNWYSTKKIIPDCHSRKSWHLIDSDPAPYTLFWSTLRLTLERPPEAQNLL